MVMMESYICRYIYMNGLRSFSLLTTFCKILKPDELFLFILKFSLLIVRCTAIVLHSCFLTILLGAHKKIEVQQGVTLKMKRNKPDSDSIPSSVGSNVLLM